MLEFKTTPPNVEVPADYMTLMSVFDLTPLEAKVLQAMLVTTGWIGKKEVPSASASFRQIIFTLRSKLARKHSITILNNGRGKYAIPAIEKQALGETITKYVREA